MLSDVQEVEKIIKLKTEKAWEDWEETLRKKAQEEEGRCLFCLARPRKLTHVWSPGELATSMDVSQLVHPVEQHVCQQRIWKYI